MRPDLLAFLRCPEDGSTLDLLPVEYSQDREPGDVAFGLLRSAGARRFYPVLAGVPVMLPGSVPPELLERASLEGADREACRACLSAPGEGFSFSGEWREFFDRGVTRTWGWLTSERLSMALLEAGVDEAFFPGKTVLDAGCGHGLLTGGFASLGAVTVGLDYSESLFAAEARRRSPDVHFVRGSVLAPPLAAEAFDLVYSSGVLHHTPDTREAFRRIAALARPGGLLYVFLYRWTLEPLPLAYNAVTEALRLVVSRLPERWQRRAVGAFTALAAPALRLAGDYQKRSRDEFFVSVYDSITPRHARRHTPTELACWFFENGYGPAALTHWDNHNGFGMAARRDHQERTPGVNYGQERSGRRRWR
ncbi:Malonyl-[acyl-carrier protein] O-methyltransferase [Fundidesulfovibrio magnetotacticus]|uniref:Malonyl-[acyl-carrier protein] O-methyltransferase n=1 Tax=Fundidesulfovibrio magnetotacticus TaxID=2730080 RepID=A0A6V8LNJ0_9BACT|nr:methyltransferase domain-containing protein [Fundidesulfovibrio magnetotacticus]GFK94183.1 Malonyl-[acyl-carrier protein] O-methyltransferase [Fundidesulfovibrio magnetotacticus]